MDYPLDLKELEKLAKTCRKAGIKSFKGHGVEFTLSDDVPTTSYKKAKETKKLVTIDDSKDIASDLPGTDAMLFWSSDGFENSSTNE